MARIKHIALTTKEPAKVAEFGVSHIEMPATPERVWRAIHRNRASPSASSDGQ